MTYPTLNLTESQALTALRAFLLSILPAGTEVVKGQDNRVAQPTGPDFVVLTPILRERMAVNVVTFTDGYPSNPQTRSDLQSVRMTVQADIHGPAGADSAQIITTLFRSEVATSAFAASVFDVMPIFNSEPRQAPFLNEAQQIETRWSVDLVLQCNPVVTTAQEFASALSVGVVSVDAAYPPN